MQQFRFLQEPDFTSRILQAQGCKSTLANCMRLILEVDMTLTISKGKDHPSLLKQDVSWPALWDGILDHGPLATKYATKTLSILTRPFFRDCICDICNNKSIHSCSVTPSLNMWPLSTCLKSQSTFNPALYNRSKAM